MFSHIRHIWEGTISIDDFIKCKEMIERLSGKVTDISQEFFKLKIEPNQEIKFTTFIHWAIKRSFIFKNLEKSVQKDALSPKSKKKEGNS